MKVTVPPRITLLIIASLFVLPLALAWMLYTGSLRFAPAQGQNLGTLVTPPMAVEWDKTLPVAATGRDSTQNLNIADTLLNHWVILYSVTDGCDAPCRKQIASLRQIYLASGRNQTRIRLALVLDETFSADTPKQLIAIYDKFLLIRDPSNSLHDGLDRARGSLELPPEVNPGTYLIDPLGNIMMYYAADSDPNHILLDLKRLLTWSKLDEQ